jgi:REP element-mobilizing transposase RayT
MKNEKFLNKYRIPSARLKHWDYRWGGAYLITICTKDRRPYFGKIEDGKMILSNLGVLADVCWHEIKNHHRNVELGEFVVMPNHIHGILILDDHPNTGENDHANVNGNGGGNGGDGNGNDHANVETGHALSLQVPQRRFQNIGKNSISAMVGGYKAAVTKHANRLGLEFAWQTRFHDHIIRNAQAFETISLYIINNPMNWEKDKFYA